MAKKHMGREKACKRTTKQEMERIQNTILTSQAGRVLSEEKCLLLAGRWEKRSLQELCNEQHLQSLLKLPASFSNTTKCAYALAHNPASRNAS